MYLEITTRCNMHCEHCCMAATERGMDMSLATFKQACKLAEDRDDSIALGGGEPTLHPRFWEFLGLALGYTSRWQGTSVWLATNGSQTEMAIRLAGMARNGVIGVALSQDDWHDVIDQSVIDAFKDGPDRDSWNRCPVSDYREIRTIQYDRVIPAGRAKEWGKAVESCACSDLFMTPKGRLYSCGCKKESLGTVSAPKIYDGYVSGECYRHQEREQEIPEMVEA